MSKQARMLERMYSDYYLQIFSFLHSTCHDEDAAESLTKKTFLKVRKSILRYNGRITMHTWLMGIAADELLNYLRRSKAEIFSVNIYITEPDAPLFHEPGRWMKKNVKSAELKKALSIIPDRDIKVLILVLYGSISYEEIAGLFEISEDSVKLIFSRTKELIKEELFHD